jgi:hypothetical protein
MPITQERLYNVTCIATASQQRLISLYDRAMKLKSEVVNLPDVDDVIQHINNKQIDGIDMLKHAFKSHSEIVKSLHVLIDFILENQLPPSEIMKLQDEKTHFNLTSRRNLKYRSYYQARMKPIEYEPEDDDGLAERYAAWLEEHASAPQPEPESKQNTENEAQIFKQKNGVMKMKKK